MIFGRTDVQNKILIVKRETWHRWFAWRPVEISDGRTAWLQTIECKGVWESGYDGGYWSYRYREIKK